MGDVVLVKDDAVLDTEFKMIGLETLVWIHLNHCLVNHSPFKASLRFEFSPFWVVLPPCSLVVAARGASSVAEASVRLSVFPSGSALVLELLRCFKLSLLLRSLLCAPQIEWWSV